MLNGPVRHIIILTGGHGRHGFTHASRTIRLFSHVTREFTTLNLLKSLYNVVFIAWLAVLGVYALVQFTGGTPPLLSWLGLALSAFGPLAFIAMSHLLKPPRAPGPAIAYSIVCGLGLAMAMAMSHRHGPAAGFTHVWAGLTLIGWLIWLRWFSMNR